MLVEDCAQLFGVRPFPLAAVAVARLLACALLSACAPLPPSQPTLALATAQSCAQPPPVSYEPQVSQPKTARANWQTCWRKQIILNFVFFSSYQLNSCSVISRNTVYYYLQYLLTYLFTYHRVHYEPTTESGYFIVLHLRN